MAVLPQCAALQTLLYALEEVGLHGAVVAWLTAEHEKRCSPHHSLHNNKIGVEGVRLIAAALKQCAVLKELMYAFEGGKAARCGGGLADGGVRKTPFPASQP